MSKFLKQLIFIASFVVVFAIGALAIYSATPSGNLKVNPILGHDLDLNAKYAGNNF